MKQFKAEWQEDWQYPVIINHLITQHNALCEHLAEREKFHGETPTIKAAPITITLPKPEWWEDIGMSGIHSRNGYLQALEAASKASGILFKLED